MYSDILERWARDQRRNSHFAKAKAAYRQKCLRIVHALNYRGVLEPYEYFVHDPKLIATLYANAVRYLGDDVGTEKQFRDNLYPRHSDYDEYVWRVRTYSKRWLFYSLHNVCFRERMPKKGSAAKKDRTPKSDSYVTDPAESRREWRAKKRPGGPKRRNWRTAGKAYGKWVSNRTHRAWERQCIADERYDDLGVKLRKDIFDPWIWD